MKTHHILRGLALAAAIVPVLAGGPARAETREAAPGHPAMERGPSIALEAMHHGPDAASSMPKIAPTRVWTVTGDEDWDALTGFGRTSPFVAMMNLMMVGGSGFENMRMPAVKPEDHMKDYPPGDPEDPTGFMNSHLGSRDRMVDGRPSILGELDRAAAQPAPHHPAPPVAPPAAPKPVEAPPAPPEPPAEPEKPAPKPVEPPKPAAPALTAAIAAPKVGKNVVDIRLTGADGAPISGAKIAAEVNMTNMDMGVARPAVKEVSPGRYQTTVNFSMRGPWRIVLNAAPKDGAPVSGHFDFRVK